MYGVRKHGVSGGSGRGGKKKTVTGSEKEWMDGRKAEPKHEPTHRARGRVLSITTGRGGPT